MTQTDTVQDRIRDFIIYDQSQLQPEDRATLTNDLDLIDSGLLDSMALAELGTVIEEAFGVTLDPTEYIKANIGTLDAIAKFVANKKKPAAT